MSKTPVNGGRSAELRARQLEFKQMLLEHTDVPKAIETVIQTALDDNHNNKTVAQKILVKGTFLFLIKWIWVLFTM